MGEPIFSMAMLGGALMEVLIGKGLDEFIARLKQENLSPEKRRGITRIERKVVEEMKPFFRYETANWTEADRRVVVMEAALTLTRVPLTAEALIADNRNPERLAKRFHEAPKPTAFSLDQNEVYKRLLTVASGAIMRVADEVEGLGRHESEAVLEGIDAILEKLWEGFDHPNQEAEQHYRLMAATFLNRMELFGVSQVDRLHDHQSLSTSFIMLWVQRERKTQEEVGPMDTSEWRHLRDDSLSHHPIEPIVAPADEILAQKMKRVVIVGQPGSGKTTLLRWLAVRAALRECPPSLREWSGLVPFYIRLRDRVGKGFPLPQEFPSLIAPAIYTPDGWAQRLLKKGQALVLVDGIDELPLEQRGAMLEGLNELVKSFPLAHYLISSRPTALREWEAWQTWVKLEQFQEVTLQEMNSELIESFVDHWHQAVGKVPTLGAAERVALRTLPSLLKLQLRQRPVLRKLATTPLMCAMLCVLFREHQHELPAERVALYAQCCDVLLQGREKGRGVAHDATYPNLEPEQQRSILSTFALWLLRGGLLEVETERAAKQFDKWLKRFSWRGTGEGMRAYFVERTGLLTEPTVSKGGKGGTVAFTHYTFQEFLAAQQLVEDDSLDELLEHATADRWRETIILAAGSGDHGWGERLVSQLLERAKTAFADNMHRHFHLLALACLETARPKGMSEKIQQQVLEQARPYFPPQDMVEAELFAKVGAPAIPLLMPAPNQSGQADVACIRALTLIGNEAAMEALMGYADKSNETEPRKLFDSLDFSLDFYLTLSELSQGWENFDQEKYTHMVLARCKALNLTTLASWDTLHSFGFLEGLRVEDASNLTSFNPLQNLPNITHLEFRGSAASDLTPLQHLTNLTYLALTESMVSDLTPLQHLTNLTYLALIESGVDDLASLQSLSKLYHLNLRQSAVHDLTPLQSLTNLTYLHIGQSAVSNLSPLQNLIDLRFLGLGECPVNDLTPIAFLTNLTELYLQGTAVSDITPLADLTNLQNLDLSQSGVSDLTPLQGLTNLQWLYLSQSGVSDLNPLYDLYNLVVLDLRQSRVSDLTPLQDLTNLSGLYLSRDQLPLVPKWLEKRGIVRVFE